MNESLVDTTRLRLRSLGNLALVSRETGLTYSWITKFADGRISNPTVRTLAALVRYLDRAPTGHHRRITDQ